jgi:hypothetical protein
LDTNVVGIYTGSVGTHKFSTLSSSRQVSYVKVINKGEGYTNRKLIVKPTGISTTKKIMDLMMEKLLNMIMNLGRYLELQLQINTLF